MTFALIHFATKLSWRHIGEWRFSWKLYDNAVKNCSDCKTINLVNLYTREATWLHAYEVLYFVKKNYQILKVEVMEAIFQGQGLHNSGNFWRKIPWNQLFYQKVAEKVWVMFQLWPNLRASDNHFFTAIIKLLDSNESWKFHKRFSRIVYIWATVRWCAYYIQLLLP